MLAGAVVCLTVLCHLSLSVRCGLVCITKLFLHVVGFWFWGSQVVLAEGNLFCGGTRVENVRVVCYYRVRVGALLSGPSYVLGGV